MAVGKFLDLSTEYRKKFVPFATPYCGLYSQGARGVNPPPLGTFRSKDFKEGYRVPKPLPIFPNFPRSRFRPKGRKKKIILLN